MGVNKKKRYKRAWREKNRKHIQEYDKRYYAKYGKKGRSKTKRK